VGPGVTLHPMTWIFVIDNLTANKLEDYHFIKLMKIHRGLPIFRNWVLNPFYKSGDKQMLTFKFNLFFLCSTFVH